MVLRLVAFRVFAFVPLVTLSQRETYAFKRASH